MRCYMICIYFESYPILTTAKMHNYRKNVSNLAKANRITEISSQNLRKETGHLKS